jgi:hypothetical protein
MIQRATGLLPRTFIGVVLLLASCATAPKPPASSPRIADAAPEKAAAQRAAGPHGLELEQNDGRWGFDAARDRKRQQDAAKAKQAAAEANKSLDVMAPSAR